MSRARVKKREDLDASPARHFSPASSRSTPAKTASEHAPLMASASGLEWESVEYQPKNHLMSLVPTTPSYNMRMFKALAGARFLVLTLDTSLLFFLSFLLRLSNCFCFGIVGCLISGGASLPTVYCYFTSIGGMHGVAQNATVGGWGWDAVECSSRKRQD
jgi:hypothetical protein